MGAHRPAVSTLKTSILEIGRTSFFRPCERSIYVKERFTYEHPKQPLGRPAQDGLGKQIFNHTIEGNKLAPSIDIMNTL